jgi:hypothetical protein
MFFVLVMMILDDERLVKRTRSIGWGIPKNFYFGSNVILGSDEADDGLAGRDSHSGQLRVSRWNPKREEARLWN